MKIRIGIVSYGNVGRGAEYALMQNKDMELRYIFSRKNVSSIEPVTEGVPVKNVSEARMFAQEIDVLLLCGSSAAALPVQTPELAAHFNVVDSFDTHAKVAGHFDKVDAAAASGKKTAVIAAGWDPGVFSLIRLINESVLPEGDNYTFYGYGVSQGHSDAIRQIDGVLDARQYTVPVEASLRAVKNGERPALTPRTIHRRVCYVTAAEGADYTEIERRIVNMPDYFADNDTSVTFISNEEMAKNHSGMPHAGVSVRSGGTGLNGVNGQTMEFNLKLDSNPEFTANILAMCARAAYRLNKDGAYGCKTMFDIPPSYYSIKSADELRRTLI